MTVGGSRHPTVSNPRDEDLPLALEGSLVIPSVVERKWPSAHEGKTERSILVGVSSLLSRRRNDSPAEEAGQENVRACQELSCWDQWSGVSAVPVSE
jgi:hypothetical protein